MFDWLSQCFGGMGITTLYQRARLICTYADWTVPDQQSFTTVINTFKGQNTQTDPETAINSFFMHLQQDQQRRNAAFLLKHLLIMDFAVEERVFLSKISHYQNNQFLYLSGGASQLISSSIKDLIANYYKYIRAKAKYYSTQSIDLVSKQRRQKFMQSATSISMLNQINICFKVQNSILEVSDSFLNGNKSPQIIQAIFSSLLKTYLFCFSIVSLALKAFINRIPTLSKYDLQYLSKLANYFSKQYTRNLLLFIERNKLIDNFKPLKYNQLIILDDKILGIIQNKVRQLQQDSAQCPQITELPIQISENLQIQKIQGQNYGPRQSEILQTRQRRKKLDLLRGFTAEEEPQTSFYEYKNFYSENFIIKENNEKDSDFKTLDKLSSSKKSSTTQKKRPIYTKLSFSKDVNAPNLKKQMSIEQNKKFNKQAWESWQNIYCS